MKLHTMFLHPGCILPDSLKLEQKQFNKTWMSTEDIGSAALDVAIRKAGWHFIWIESASSGLGCGTSEAVAIDRATSRALRHSSGRFNAAEVVSMRVSTYLGISFARVTVRARQIQEQAQLNGIDGTTLRQLPVG